MAKKVSTCAILTALALVLSYVEAMIPFHFGIPGIKLGLANLVIVIGFYVLKPREVLIISVVRILLAGFMFGSGFSILYSLAGGMLSFAVMLLMIRIRGFSVWTVSIAGGVCHNLGQLIVAALVVSNLRLGYYAPVLMIAGALTGALIGLIAGRILAAIGRGSGYTQSSKADIASQKGKDEDSF